MSDSNEKFKALQQLPQFPAIATKVLRVLSQEDSNIQEIANLIRADASLASGLLRIANSPLHASYARISSIERALILLGSEDVKRFVLTASMKGFFQSSMRLDVLRSIWRHSLACAIVSEELSEACSPTQSRDDRAYTTGLLHDIGRLGLFVVHPQAYAELLLAKNPTEDIRERERKAFGFDHCEAGGWLAANWGLPEDVQKIASGHHDTPDATASLENLVRVGILLTDSFGFDVTPPARVYTLAEVRSFLPRSAQYRFDPDPEELKTRITVKLDAYD